MQSTSVQPQGEETHMSQGDTYASMESALQAALSGVNTDKLPGDPFHELRGTYDGLDGNGGQFAPDPILTAYAAKQTGHYIQDHGHLTSWGTDGDSRCAMGAAGSAIFNDVQAYGGLHGAVVTFRAFVNALVHDDLARLKRYDNALSKNQPDPNIIMSWNDNLAQGGREVATRCFKLARRLLRRGAESAEVPASFAEVTAPESDMAPIGFAESFTK